MTTTPDLDAIERRRDKAQQTVADLCQGKIEWIMSIPAQRERDPDLIIAAALKDEKDLLAAYRAQQQRIAELEAQIEQKYVEGWDACETTMVPRAIADAKDLP